MRRTKEEREAYRKFLIKYFPVPPEGSLAAFWMDCLADLDELEQTARETRDVYNMVLLDAHIPHTDSPAVGLRQFIDEYITLKYPEVK